MVNQDKSEKSAPGKPASSQDQFENVRLGQTVRVKIVSTPKARHRRIALNFIFRRSPEVVKRWAEDNGAARVLESVRENRKFPNRRRIHNQPRFQLKVGAECVLPNINSTHLHDLQCVRESIQVTVEPGASDRKPVIVGFNK